MTAERGYNDLNSAKNQNNFKKNNIVIREDKIKERREENFKVFKLLYGTSSMAQMVEKKICLQCWRPRFDPWVEKVRWRREWLPTPVFLPGESHEQRIQD